jgi:hypothetical protein
MTGLSIGYILHYLVARSLFSLARSTGIPVWCILLIAVSLLLAKPAFRLLKGTT